MFITVLHRWHRALLVGALCYCCGIVVKAHMFVVRGGSMAPTLCPGALVWTVRPTDLKRGALVLIRMETDTIVLVKRLIGVPHDTLEYGEGIVEARNGGAIWRRSARQIDPPRNWHYGFVPSQDRSGVSTRHAWKPIVLPNDAYFVLGDNLASSGDSRRFGFLHKDEILAEAIPLITPRCEGL